MRWDQFCGPSSSTLSQDVQRAVNFFCEGIESSGKNEQFALLGTPGRVTFATLTDVGIRAMHAEPSNRLFVVSGSKFYEVDSSGAAIERGDVSTDGLPAKIASSTVDGGVELFIASDRKGFLYDLETDTLTGPIDNVDPFDVVQLGTYFVALSSLGIQWSTPLDGSTWDPLDFTGPGGLALLADRKELWVYRAANIEVYYITDEETVFQATPSGFIQQGLLAPYSVAQIDNAQFSLGGDARGHAVVWSSEGYAPRRVSWHGVEQALQRFSLPVLTGARGYAYQEGGHSFYVLNFPGAPAGYGAFVYDTSTRQWHERARWIGDHFGPERGCLHAFCFGKHLVGDPVTGVLYQQSMELYDDAGEAIRRWRRSPRLTDELRLQTVDMVQVDLEVGLGTATVELALSGDGGKTFKNARSLPVGPLGQFSRRVRAACWGDVRDVVLDLVVSAAVPWRISNVYLNPDN